MTDTEAGTPPIVPSTVAGWLDSTIEHADEFGADTVRVHVHMLRLARELLAVRPAADPAGLDAAMRSYFAARGSAIPVITTGQKAIEEATELVEAIAEGDAAHIREEVADLALVAAVVAAQYGSTVEACIAEKANRDTGRGEPKQAARLSVADGPGPEERHTHGPGGPSSHCEACLATLAALPEHRDADRDA